MNEKINSDTKRMDYNMDKGLDLKLQHMGNTIKENIKNQVSQLTQKLIDTKKRSRSFKNKSSMEVKKIGDRLY